MVRIGPFAKVQSNTTSATLLCNITTSRNAPSPKHNFTQRAFAHSQLYATRLRANTTLPSASSRQQVKVTSKCLSCLSEGALRKVVTFKYNAFTNHPPPKKKATLTKQRAFALTHFYITCIHPYYSRQSEKNAVVWNLDDFMMV